jgi:hypothetical protein
MKQFSIRLTGQLTDENRQGDEKNGPVNRLAKRPTNLLLDPHRGDKNSRQNPFINHSVLPVRLCPVDPHQVFDAYPNTTDGEV